MLSPFVKLREHCPLCQKLKSGAKAPDFLFDGGHVYVYKSPFADRWTGAIMPVFKKHIYEVSDIRPAELPDTLMTLVSFERALRKTTQCERINFVKFGNVTHHLHWHLIPRYADEIFKTSNWPFHTLTNKTFIP